MFIQVVRAKVSDADAMVARSDEWQEKLRPGAKGYLGVTSGVADDGTFVAVVRFDSEESAQANSERPEQSAWMEETAKLFTEPPTFYNCTIVEEFLGGGSDDAGFVQLMVYKTKDIDALLNLSKEFASFASMRPDLMGGTTAIATDGTVIDTNYFTSEKAAREGERQTMTPQVADLMQRMQDLVDGDVEFIDLRDPILR